MRSRHTLLNGILLVAIAAVVTTLAGDSAAQGDPDSISLEKLQERIVALEFRVATLESERSGVQPAAGVVAPVETIPGPLVDDLPRLPRKAIRGEINGVPFYTLPLGRSDQAD